MKIVLTAPPQTGKSTIVNRVTSLFKAGDEIRGIWSREKLDNGQRVGFTTILSDGSELLFMTKDRTSSNIETSRDPHIGRYRVHVDIIDEFIVPELESCVFAESGIIVYIDEIGKAQALSNTFLSVARELFHSEHTVLATIVHSNEPWSLFFKEHPDTWLIDATEENRDALTDIVNAMLRAVDQFNTLESEQQQITKELFLSFLTSGQYVAARKLFQNAVRYVVERRVQSLPLCEEVAISGGGSTAEAQAHGAEWFLEEILIRTEFPGS